jgi:hypothetical protein
MPRSWRPVLIAAVAGFAAAVVRIFEKNDRAALINIGDYEPQTNRLTNTAHALLLPPTDPN